MSHRLPQYYCRLRKIERYLEGSPLFLMYHSIARPRAGWRGRGLLSYVDPGLFRRQINELREAGFATRLPDAARDCGGKSVIITFDDGYENVLKNAAEPLRCAGFSGITYLVHGLIGKTNEWDIPKGIPRERLMDRSQVLDWLQAGQAIGSHTLTHPFLTRIPIAQAREEIIASKKRLEDMFGLPIEHFCYPYGDRNAAVRDIVIEAGYKTAGTLKCGLNSADTSPFELRRFMVRYPKWNLSDWFALLTKRDAEAR